MAEETQDAAVNVPRGIMGSYLIGVGSGLVMLITFCFCFTSDALNSATGYAFMAVYQTTTGSNSGALALTVILIILTFFSATNFMASASRQAYAFARDGGLPFSKHIAKVCNNQSRCRDMFRQANMYPGFAKVQCAHTGSVHRIRIRRPSVPHRPRKLRRLLCNHQSSAYCTLRNIRGGYRNADLPPSLRPTPSGSPMVAW